MVGVGRTQLSTRSGRTTLSLAVEAITRAVADAGLSMSDIDGLALHAASDCAPLHEVATTLGLRTVRWFHEEWGGGSKAPVILASAATACATGDATNVVIFRALNGRSGMRMGCADRVPQRPCHTTSSIRCRTGSWPRHSPTPWRRACT